MTEGDGSEGWATATLPEVAKITLGQSPPGRTYNTQGKGLPFFQGKADFGDRHPSVRIWCTEPKKVAQPGDVLISVRAPVGPTNVADQTCAIGRGLAALTPVGGTPTEFILHFLRSKEQEISMSGTGSTFTAISKRDLEVIEVPVAPLAEQKRIVAAVEGALERVKTVSERVGRARSTAALPAGGAGGGVQRAVDGR
jgi:type I restriction enzyme S subunit